MINTHRIKLTLFLLTILCFNSINLVGCTSLRNNTVNSTIDTNVDFLVLSEDVKINISGKKAQYINFNIQKKVRYKVLSQRGLLKCSLVTLPESFDPTYIEHFAEKRNYTNVLSNLKINDFKATIISNSNKEQPAQVMHTTEDIKMVMIEKEYYGNYQKHNYNIEDLKIDDEIVIEYNYSADYLENYLELSSFRIFFHGEADKTSYHLSVSHSKNLDIDIAYLNEADPKQIEEIDNKKVYKWEYQNLSGCIKEVGSRPHLSLPHLTFSVKPKELLYQIPFSFDAAYVPFYTLFAFQREKEHLPILKAVSHGVTMKQYAIIKNYVANETSKIIDSTGYQQLKTIKNKIATEFEFQDDVDYFNRIDTRRQRIGEFLENKTLRDVSRYDTYVALITQIGLQYFTAYVCDKRAGVITDDFVKPMQNGDYLFAVIQKDNKMSFLYPKKSKFGFFLNELPFYFENTLTRLVYIDDYMDIRKPINTELRQKTLPGSAATDNVRQSSSLININLDSLLLKFRTRVSLSGQYSTMTRGLYQFDHHQTQVNQFYNKKIWAVSKNVTVQKEEVKIQSDEFPFPAVVNASYQCSDLLYKKDETFVLPLKNLINHVYYQNIESVDRKLDYYADFKGRDSYTYSLKFNESIELLSAYEDVTIKNDFGELVISIKQTDDTSIQVTSFLAINSDNVEAKDFNHVSDIFSHIDNLKQSELVLKKIE